MRRHRKSTLVAALFGLLVTAGSISASAAYGTGAPPWESGQAGGSGSWGWWLPPLLVAFLLVLFGAAIARRRRTPARA
jgi:hypothetical protein